MEQRSIRWGTDDITVVLAVDASGPVRLAWIGSAGTEPPSPLPAPVQPLVEVFVVGHGHARHNLRHTASAVGQRLRYVAHDIVDDDNWQTLTIEQTDDATGLTVRSVLAGPHGAAALRSWTHVRNGGRATLALQAVTSFASGAFAPGDVPLHGIDSVTGTSEWLGEGRWHRIAVRDESVDLNLPIHQAQDARSRIQIMSQGTWSSGERIPVGVVEDGASGRAWAWQVEHNGGWLTELAERLGAGHGELAVTLGGPTDVQHQWLLPLAPGAEFTTVPVAVAVAETGWQDAVAALTRYRRVLRVDRHPASELSRLPVVFNDYMNTLMGDPTTAKLLPLIDAAAAVGAEVFCIDAGWYDDGGDWWDSVGEWEPSTGRFPDGGLGRVIDHIRAAGMVPGLWLEPEVVGVRSAMATRLPDEAFLQRAGVPVIEHARLHLDLRHPAARAHLDGVVDRLVRDFGIGYVKLDYNITPGQGTDRDAPSVGVGLLDHNRAHLDWLDGVLARHPHLLVENCASGAQRADYALLARVHIQSTSDQQDPLRYPPIAAAAPLTMLPEQAGSWAYPQPGMEPEQTVLTLATGMLGRLYLSGHLDQMESAQLGLVREAVATHRALVVDVARSVPVWPLGLPGWRDPWVATGLVPAGPGSGRSAPDALAFGEARDLVAYLTVWHREPAAATVELSLPAFAGDDLEVVPVFPEATSEPGGWTYDWSTADGVLRVATHVASPSARVIGLRRRR